jgi:hypothetical protein
MISRWKDEEASYDAGIEGFLRWHSIWGPKLQISQNIQFCPEQNFSSPTNFQKS